MRKSRNYKAEYARRMERALARGLSRSQGRGHPRGTEAYSSTKPTKPAIDLVLEKALRRLRGGSTLRLAAQEHRVSAERLSRYIKTHAGAARVGRNWVFNDPGRRRVPFIKDGKVIHLWVIGYEPARLIGAHWAEAHAVLADHDLAAAFIRRWENVVIRDDTGQLHTFTTDLNEIYAAVHADDTPFDRIYRLVR